MLIFEHVSTLKRKPIIMDIKADKSDSFKELFHFHPGVEMIYVHEGVGRIIVEQHMYEVKRGSFLFLRPFQPHYLQMRIAPEHAYVRTLIKYEPHYVTEHLKAFPNLLRFHEYLLHDSMATQVQQLAHPEQMERFLEESAQRIQMHPSRHRMEGNALFLISLLHYLQPQWKHYDSAKQPTHASSPVVAQIMNWIEQNFAKNFQLEELSQTVHLTPNHVSFLFHKATGKTITEFITARRLKHACLLLKTTSLSVQEIGEKSGWPNSTYFCHVFKKHIGVTPKRYRSL